MDNDSKRVEDALHDYINSQDELTSVIAKRHGISASTLTVWAKKAGLTLRGRGRPAMEYPTARTREILTMAETLTLEATGARHGMSKQRVSRIVKRWKGWRRPRQSPFSVGDVIQWKGNVYKVVEEGVMCGKVVDQNGVVVHNFYWNMGGALAVRVDASKWEPKKEAARSLEAALAGTAGTKPCTGQ